MSEDKFENQYRDLLKTNPDATRAEAKERFKTDEVDDDEKID